MMLAREKFEQDFVRPLQGRTLVAGSRVYAGRPDRRKLYENAEGWDALPGDGVDRVLDLQYELPAETIGSFSHIDCLSVLEHATHPWLLAHNLERLLCVGGTLFLTVPFVWRVHGYPDDLWRFTVSGVRSLFTRLKWDALLYAHLKLTDEKLAVVNIHDYPYFARTEVCGFGKLR